jgi:hypothetical protein
MTEATTPPDRSGDEARTFRLEKLDFNNPIHSGALRQDDTTGEYINENVRRAPKGHIAFPASRFAGGKTLEEHDLEKQGEGLGARRALRRRSDPAAQEAQTKAIAELKAKRQQRSEEAPSTPNDSDFETSSETPSKTSDTYSDNLRAREERKKKAIAENNARIAAAKARQKKN